MNKAEDAGYKPRLDTLRAMAVLMVIISHWLPGSHWLNRYTANGILGVTLFFVLSGYLITGILLKSKKMLQKGLSLKKAFAVFYIRRSLRIFPLYYLFILLLLLFFPSSVKPSLYWHLFYASNFYFWHINGFSPQLSHLWSLAVEEQFYLLWPAVILLITPKKLPVVFIGCIVFAMVFRALMYSPPGHIGRLLMPGSLDSFGTGALLAYGQAHTPKWYRKLLIFKNKALAAMTTAIILVQVFIHFYPNEFLVLIFYYSFISIFFFTLLLAVSESKGGSRLAGIVLDNKLLLYLGKISYGLYLFHLIIPAYNNVQVAAFLSAYRTELIAIFRFLVLVLMASASWYLFEKPILKLKNKFEINR
jgi:peptidoglycan/LPS O-acetylase OafA/YrhL